jgi:hypothetical protein
MAVSSQGITLSTGTLVGEITAISFSGVSVAEIDVTSISDTVKKYVTGTLDGGTVEITANFTTAPTMPSQGAESPSSFIITLPTGSPQLTLPFSAFVVGMSIDASVDQQIVVKYTLRISNSVLGTANA